jgi:hypothetical protein
MGAKKPRFALALEAKPALQIDSPVGGVAGEESSRQGSRLAEERRTEVAHRRSIIDSIKDVSRRDAERKVVP